MLMILYAMNPFALCWLVYACVHPELPVAQMSSEDIERRKRLESAVEDDDWSSVIDGQTKLTEEPKVEVDAPTATIIRFVLKPTSILC